MLISDHQEQVVHRRLDCGIELAVMPLPARSVAAIEIRVFAGYAYEPAEHLGVTHVLDEVLPKGTASYDGRGLNDAFDVIGATHGSAAGRETVGFSCLCLPEFIDRAIELHAEMIRTPTFPPEACAVAVELSRQSLAAMNDDPDDLIRKFQERQAYGEPLGRHALGESETLDRVDREAIVAHWSRLFSARHMLVAVAGAVDADRVAELLEKAFGGFICRDEAAHPARLDGERGRVLLPLRFQAGASHHHKDLEQEHVAICFPSVAVTDADYPVERVLLGVLSGGMSGRLFTEVREKLGLVYWVGAWADHPRGSGVLHLGASTTPQRVDQTYAMLLREINRVEHDLTDEEVRRAITGIVTPAHTREDVTRARAGRLVEDLFHRGRPVPLAEKIARIEAVTADDIRRFLADHRRDLLSIATLGPRPLVDSPAELKTEN